MPTPTPTDLTGTTLAGRYRILRKLGEGAMGTVYLGEHTKIGRQDAIKVLRDVHAGDAEAIARFNRGARNVAAIHHPNVCTIYDYSDTGDGAQFVAMQFIPGESLKEILDREGALPLDRAVAIAKQTADALQAAHEAGIVHRDLKPANIMVSRDRRGGDLVTVVDFDIAKGSREGEESEVTRLGFVVGTPEYMSPEQLTGDRLDGRSDLYSLGLVLFRMLAGSLPFTGASAQELMIKRLTQAPLRLSDVMGDGILPAHVQDGLQRVFDRSLARRAEDRHEDAAEFGEALLAATDAAGEYAGGGRSIPGHTGGPSSGTFAGTGSGTGLGAPSATGIGGLAQQVGPGFHGGGSSEEIPATRVAPPVTVSGETSPHAGRATPAGRRSPLMIAGGGIGVLVIAVLAVFAIRGSGTGAEPADPPVAVTTGPEDNLSSATNPGTMTGGGAATDASVGGEPGTGGISGASDRADPPTGAGAGGPAGSSPAPPSSPPRSPAITLPASEASDAVFRQLDALGPPAPSRASLAAIRDTAEAIWRIDGAAAADRALAAYVAGSAWFALGDGAQCTTWIGRALEIRPDGAGYSEMLGNCRRL